MVKYILGLLAILGLYFLFVFIKDYRAHRHEMSKASPVTVGIIGFVTLFFDVLGIGNFASATALLKFFKQIDDKKIPGTLNVFTSLPEVVSASFLITTIEVEPVTLISMLISSSLGAYFGAAIMSRLPVQIVRLVMGVSLFVTAVLMFFGIMGWMPSGGEATGLTGTNLIIANVGNFIIGMLMTAGIGAYAPCMALVYFLGMSPRVAFPIMMGSCAFLMPIASLKFIKEGAYDRKISLIVTLTGIVGVLIAVTLVKSIPLGILKWVVIAVVLYTSGSMIYSMIKGREKVIKNAKELQKSNA
ncbi:TSUP family transporter [Pseudodesulfovibrio sp. JC047]|uniref:sulfite exporter TauE/SafE family protein n=1 Tax=Pseudodesulfovibrio sp. JC047 TaxID=2683199 RepID=UPI0013D71014|nr:sulfite exporter TauE/SafE family protein [Pseudodesulfovibrio sp. JC047]NDV19481.1 TSUP family transporter [Pseudodesulfovibrio sp. JC047]